MNTGQSVKQLKQRLISVIKLSNYNEANQQSIQES